MAKYFFWFFFLVSLAYAEGQDDHNVSVDHQQEIAFKLAQIDQLQKGLAKGNNVWIKSYDSYTAYREARQSLSTIKVRIAFLKNSDSTDKRKLELEALQAKEKILTDQLELLKAQGSSPFVTLLKPDEAGTPPAVNNPFDIILGLSYIKRLDGQFKEYKVRSDDLIEVINNLEQQIELYKAIVMLDPEDLHHQDALEETFLKEEKFKLALDTLEATTQVYEKRIESTEAKINEAIKDQLTKLMTLVIVIIVVFALMFLIKQMVKRYVSDNERFYMVNKVITFTGMSFIILLLSFSYIDNVGYFATILGFASAGIAIAMRDWFMSMLGWFVIVLGGSIHVGDRIRVEKDGMIYLGDVLDISFQRLTLLEDVTLTTLMHNRRAGRIIFVPNNYVFTSMIANYTHGSLKTVWDGIDIIITFESNHKKAAHLVKEICRKYSKGYTDITRKQLNKLRDHYSLKNTNVEPRIFTFIEPNGIKISAWYLTNAYGTLTLRSTISGDIVDAFKHEEDITIAYPTQTVHASLSTPHEFMKEVSS